MTHAHLFSIHVLADALLRGGELAAVMVLIGLLGFRTIVLRPEEQGRLAPATMAEAAQFLDRLAVGAIGCFLVAMVGEFMHVSMQMSRQPLSQIWPLLWPILSQTQAGWMTAAQAFLVAAWIVIWARAGRHGAAKAGSGRLLALGALLALTESLTGHAASHGNWTIDVLVDWIHLLAVSFWAGGLVPLALLVPRLAKQLDPHEARRLLMHMLQRFSIVAMTSVGALIVTGLMSATWRGVQLSSLLASEYSGVLALKVSLVAVAVALGGVSRFLILPGLRCSVDGSVLALQRSFRRVIAIELGVVVMVFTLAAFLTQLPPPDGGYGGVSSSATALRSSSSS